MKFDNSHTQALKDFVIHLLRNCPGNSADEDILADYVIALLKYDKPRSELRRLCSSQLDDFLKEETQPFVAKLFQALSTEEYLGGNKQPPSGSGSSRESLDTLDNNAEHGRARPVNGSPHDESLNRRRQEKSPDANSHRANRSLSPRAKGFSTGHATDFATQDGDVAIDEKAAKRPRPEEFGQQTEEPSRASKMQRSLPPQTAPGPRVGPSSHPHSGHQNHGPTALQHRRQDMPMGRGGHMGPGIVRPMHPIAGRVIHPQWPHGGPNVNIPGQQRMPQASRGMPPAMGGGHPQDQSRGGRKPRCRDYDERGFCIRGETCPFDHGQDRIIDDASLPRPMPYNPAGFPNMPGMPGNMRPPFFVPMGGPSFEGMMGNMNRVPMPVGPDIPMQAGALPPSRGPVASPPVANPTNPPQPTFESARGGIRGGSGFRGGGRGRGGRGGSSGPRANFHAQKGFTLLVENIPENHCAIDKVNDFFKKFGTVTNIQVDPQNSKALVQFSNNAEAYKAYSSPEPIFDNRFVRVFWHEKEKEPSFGDPQTPASSSAPASDAAGPAATVAAHAAHLAEVNAAREEKARLRKEQMEKMLEVQRQKEALIQKQIEEQKLLMEAMSKNSNIPEQEKAELLRRLESVAKSVLPVATTSPTSASGTSQAGAPTRPPSAKLAEDKERERLDRELDFLSKMGDKGPQSSSAEVTEALQAKLDQLKAEAAILGVSEHSFRGRGGGYRARGRGSWAPRGRGGGAAAYKPYSLDLRPTKILVKSVPASVQPKLKEHFERYGHVESVSLDGGAGNAIVHYKTRHEAEKAFYNGGKLEDLSEKLELAWYQDPTTTTSTSTPSSASILRPNSAASPVSSSVPPSLPTPSVHMEDVPLRSDVGAESEEDDEDGERNWKRGI